MCAFSSDEIAHPGDYEHIYSSRHSSGDDTLYIKFDINFCEGKSHCRVIIGVYGESVTKSTFTITATT